jgi:SAM-dependent methyltransferase
MSRLTKPLVRLLPTTVRTLLRQCKQAILKPQHLNPASTTTVTTPEPDYPLMHARLAADHVKIRQARCLVVGCNTGGDCRNFIRLGAAAVDGVDVVEEVGAEFPHPRVRYFRLSAEQMDGIEDNAYDLVFCFATMEHVPRIDLAFPELVRVAKPGGIIYCLAAPLWQSSQGHHKGEFFADYPWIHLRRSRDEILHYCQTRGITPPTSGQSMAMHVDYMLNRAYFNRTPGRAYIEVCKRLPNVEILTNELVMNDERMLTPEIWAELSPKGYTREDLLAVWHSFLARKR